MVALAMASIQVTQASTVVHFLDLNDEDGASNTVNIGGSTSSIDVVRTVASGNYTYAVTYTGMDYDGDRVNDTLQFNLTVAGYTGSSITFGGSNDSVVSLVTPAKTTNVFLSSVQNLHRLQWTFVALLTFEAELCCPEKCLYLHLSPYLHWLFRKYLQLWSFLFAMAIFMW